MTEPAAVPCPLERTAGIDWYRYITEDGEAVREALEMADAIHEEDRQRGSRFHPWSFQQYHGYASESLRWGRDGGKLLWETSGQRAPSTWTRMPSRGGKATRVDLQTTLLLSQPQVDLPKQLVPPEAMTPPYLLPRGVPVRLEQGARGLYCVRVARRSAPEHWRVYDKGREQKSHDAGHLWRLELELKKADAEALACQYREEMQTPEWVSSYCVQRWRSRGCLWPWSTGALLAAPLVRESDGPVPAERLAEWLKTTVAPTMPRLLTVYSRQELLKMLGLDFQSTQRLAADERRAAIQGHRTGGLAVAGELPLSRPHPVRGQSAGADRRCPGRAEHGRGH